MWLYSNAGSTIFDPLWLCGMAPLAASVISAMLENHRDHVIKSRRGVLTDTVWALLTNPLVQRAYLGG